MTAVKIIFGFDWLYSFLFSILRRKTFIVIEGIQQGQRRVEIYFIFF